MCHGLVNLIFKIQASSFKLQQLERKATTCSEGRQEVFYLQDELAEVIGAHAQETYMSDSTNMKTLQVFPSFQLRPHTLKIARRVLSYPYSSQLM